MKVTPPIDNSNNSILSPNGPKGPNGPGSGFKDFLGEALELVNADLRSLHFRVLELEESIKSSQSDK